MLENAIMEKLKYPIWVIFKHCGRGCVTVTDFFPDKSNPKLTNLKKKTASLGHAPLYLDNYGRLDNGT